MVRAHGKLTRKKREPKRHRGRQTAVQRSILLAFRPRHGIIGSIRIKAGWIAKVVE